VNDGSLVSGIERIGDLSGERERGQHGNGTAHDLIGQRLSIHQLHHQGREALAVFDTVDRRDMRMVDGGQDACLALEALHASGV
jgi:hypothetical protein